MFIIEIYHILSFLLVIIQIKTTEKIFIREREREYIEMSGKTRKFFFIAIERDLNCKNQRKFSNRKNILKTQTQKNKTSVFAKTLSFLYNGWKWKVEFHSQLQFVDDTDNKNLFLLWKNSFPKFFLKKNKPNILCKTD